MNKKTPEISTKVNMIKVMQLSTAVSFILLDTKNLNQVSLGYKKLCYVQKL